MSVAKEFTTDRNTDVKTAGNRVIEGCNSLLVAYTRDSFKVRAGLPTENKNAVSLAGVEIIVLEGGVIRVPAAIRGHATFGFLSSIHSFLRIEGGEPSADGRGSAPPELAKQQAQAGSDAAPATPPPLGAQSTFIPLHRWGGGVKVLLRYFLTRK